MITEEGGEGGKHLLYSVDMPNFVCSRNLENSLENLESHTPKLVRTMLQVTVMRGQHLLHG